MMCGPIELDQMRQRIPGNDFHIHERSSVARERSRTLREYGWHYRAKCRGLNGGWIHRFQRVRVSKPDALLLNREWLRDLEMKKSVNSLMRSARYWIRGGQDD